MPESDSKQDSTDDEFFQIVKDFGEKTPIELVADAARSAELARVAAMKANRILSDLDVPVQVKTDALLALDSCENVMRSIVVYAGEIQ